MYMPRGRLIVIEGIDSSGKATQVRMLAQAVDDRGSVGIVYSFPRYATPVGQVILRHLKGYIAMMYEHTIDSSDHTIDGLTVHRVAPEDALVFQCLMVADKMDAACEIENALLVGHTVICDRWWQSAYAFGAADGLDPSWLARVHNELPQATMNIFIDVPPEEALRRRPEARDRYEKNRELQAKVRANYELLWKDAGPDYVKIDGLGTPEEVHARIWTAIQERS